MHSKTLLLLATALLSGAARAGMDKPAIGPAPVWVKPVTVPAKPDKADEAPVRVLLSDQQTRFETGKVVSYADVALLIQTPQGLAAGNLSFPWNPETDEITVHKLVIHRDGKDIDILAGGQTFTVMRRETNLEIATLDGMLTANIQPEGLQAGDVLEYALTISRSDPVLKGHVEEAGAAWNGVPFTRTHLRVEWPNSIPIAIRQNGDLPALKPVKAGTMTSVELSMDNVQPVIPPRLAPARYALGRVIEFSDFKSWADIAALMAPLYEKAATLPAQGPLRAEVDKIKAATTDPVKRTEAALALVQDRVRYVALLMGVGGLTPASAEETWSRRYGDCKAKTALMLAILHDLGIDAEPVLANAVLGDGIDQRSPMVGLFNHVLVRARIGGQIYWLDGTRQGDTSLARLRIPDFGWGLPLVAKNAALVRMVPAPLDKPDSDFSINIDARNGLSLPAPITAKAILRGDEALTTKLIIGQLTAAQRDEALRKYWKGELSDIDVTTSSASYDPDTGEEILTMDGKANMDWSDGWYHADHIYLGYEPDFSRPAGPDQDAPFVNSYPGYTHTVETIQLPPGFPDDKDMSGMAVDQTVAGTAYFRKASLVDNVFRIEASARSLMPEFAAKDAPAAQKGLKAIVDQHTSFWRPDTVRMTSAEVDEELKKTPTTTDGFLRQGGLLLGQNKFNEARLAFGSALKLDAANDRATLGILSSYVMSRDQEGYKKFAAGIDLAKVKLPELANMVGMGFASQGSFKEAVAAFSRSLELKPNQEQALAYRAQSYWSLGDRDNAFADAAASLKINPKQPNLSLLRVNFLRGQGQKDQALAETEDMLKGDPDNGYAHVVAAKIFDGLGQHDRGMSEIDKAIALQPDATAYTNRAYMRPRADVAGRLADFDAALKLDPGLDDAISGKAQIQLDRGDFEGAIKSYTLLIDKTPKSPWSRNSRGVAYAKLGDTAHAEADFTQARKDAEGAPAWLNNICYDKAKADVALDRALEECTAALAKQPDATSILDSKAFVLLRLGRIDDSITLFNQVLAKAPDMAPSLYGRAVAWSKKGDKAKAQADRDAALKSDPNVEKTFDGYGVTMDAAKST